MQVASVVLGASSAGGSWSPDGRYFAIDLNGTSNAGTQIATYPFDGVNLGSPCTYTSANTGPLYPIFSPDGKYMVVTFRGNNKIEVMRVNYVSTSATSQSLTSSIAFGNSKQGSSYDLNLRLLAGAQAQVSGLLNYDCVN